MAEGLTQEQMAAKLETSPRTYQDWELGVNRIHGVAAVAVRYIAKEASWVMYHIAANLLNRAERDFPGGRV